MSFGAPQSPDYAGAASTQYLSGQQATQAQTAANRINQYNPWGSVSFGADGSQTTSLNPYLQGALNSQQQVQQDLSGTAAGLTGQVNSNLASPMNWGQFSPYTDANAARDQAITGAYNQGASRLDPRMAQEHEALDARLASQGLGTTDAPTGEAGRTAGANFDRYKNDAYSSLMSGAIAQGTAAGDSIFRNSLQGRREQVGEALQQRYQPLQEIGMLEQGQGVQAPQFQGYNQAGAWAPMQALAAAGMQGQYNLGSQGLSNQMWGDIFSGLGQLGGSAMKMAGGPATAAV